MTRKLTAANSAFLRDAKARYNRPTYARVLELTNGPGGHDAAVRFLKTLDRNPPATPATPAPAAPGPKQRRTTLYAAFDQDGTPAINVWDFNLGRLQVLVGDRVANGDALAGEHIARVTVQKYRELVAKLGHPSLTEQINQALRVQLEPEERAALDRAKADRAKADVGDDDWSRRLEQRVVSAGRHWQRKYPCPEKDQPELRALWIALETLAEHAR